MLLKSWIQIIDNEDVVLSRINRREIQVDERERLGWRVCKETEVVPFVPVTPLVATKSLTSRENPEANAALVPITLQNVGVGKQEQRGSDLVVFLAHLFLFLLSPDHIGRRIDPSPVTLWVASHVAEECLPRPELLAALRAGTCSCILH